MPIPSSRVQDVDEPSPLYPDGSNVMVNGDEKVSAHGPDDSNSPVQPHEEVSPIEPGSFLFEGYE